MDKTFKLNYDLNVKWNVLLGNKRDVDRLVSEVPGSFPENTIPHRGFATVFAIGPVVVRFQASIGKV